MMKRLRVLLADDHRLVAEGLKSLLEVDFELVSVVEDGRALIEAAAITHPEVVVTDIAMPHLNGIDAITHLKKDNPAIKIVILTMHREVAYARRALDAGASGFVLKHSAPAELVMAIRAALEGRIFISPALAAEVLDSLRENQPADEAPGARLTPRQREILQLLAEGCSAKEIATALGISARTVEFHKYQMMESLHVENSAELIGFAIKQSIVTV